MQADDEFVAKRKTLGWRGDLVALGAGAMLPLSFAPYNYWFFGLLAVGLLAQLLRDLSSKRTWLRSLVFGLGMYGTGVSWVYISIHDFGFTGAAPAALMTAAFVSFLALVFSLPFILYGRCVAKSRTAVLLGFPAIWVLGEWSRSWFLTGFPWLFMGYGHISSPLGGWAPLAGVYAVSFAAVFTSTALGFLLLYLEKRLRKNTLHNLSISYVSILLGITIFIWSAGFGLKNIAWTSYSEEDKLTVSIVQPNIPLALKWNPLYRPQIVKTLLSLSSKHWDSDIILWPEAAIPFMYHDADGFVAELEHLASENNTALIAGILYDDTEEEKYYNSIMGIGAAENIYFKQRLVPFGEYVPLEAMLRGIIAFFDLPNSVINRGPPHQANLKARDFEVAPYICYEVVYPDLVAANLGKAAVMVTISNDAWFGNSIGPLQHFQMAQMRALEHGKFMIRGTNTGLSGIINDKGEITLTGTQFVAETLAGEVYRTHGHTPFSFTHSWPIIILSVLLFLLACMLKRQHTD